MNQVRRGSWTDNDNADQGHQAWLMLAWCQCVPSGTSLAVRLLCIMLAFFWNTSWYSLCLHPLNSNQRTLLFTQNVLRVHSFIHQLILLLDYLHGFFSNNNFFFLINILCDHPSYLIIHFSARFGTEKSRHVLQRLSQHFWNRRLRTHRSVPLQPGSHKFAKKAHWPWFSLKRWIHTILNGT